MSMPIRTSPETLSHLGLHDTCGVGPAPPTSVTRAIGNKRMTNCVREGARTVNSRAATSPDRRRVVAVCGPVCSLNGPRTDDVRSLVRA